MSDQTKKLQNWLIKHLPVYGYINMTVEEVGDITRCRVPLNEHNKNHFNALHAAIQFAVMELAGGLAGLRGKEIGSNQNLAVVKSLTIEFIRPAYTGVEAVVHLSSAELERLEAQMRENGRVDFDLRCELRDDSGELISKSTAVYTVRRRLKAD